MSSRVVSLFVVGFTGSCLALKKAVALRIQALEGKGIVGGSPSLQDNRQLSQVVSCNCDFLSCNSDILFIIARYKCHSQLMECPV